MKRFLGYLGFMFVLGLILYFGQSYEESFKQTSAETFNHYPLFLFMAIYPIIIGIILGIPQLIEKIKLTGNWKVEWLKILTILLPTGLINMYPILIIFFDISINKFMLNQYVLTISGIIFGYTLLASLRKDIY